MLVQRGISRNGGYLQLIIEVSIIEVSIIEVIALSLSFPQPHHLEAYQTFTLQIRTLPKPCLENFAQAMSGEIACFPVYKVGWWSPLRHLLWDYIDAQHHFVFNTFHPFSHWLFLSLPCSGKMFREATACVQGHTASEQQSLSPNLSKSEPKAFNCLILGISYSIKISLPYPDVLSIIRCP